MVRMRSVQLLVRESVHMDEFYRVVELFEFLFSEAGLRVIESSMVSMTFMEVASSEDTREAIRKRLG